MRLYPESPIQPDDWDVGPLVGGPKTLQLSLRHLSWHSLPGRTLCRNVRLIMPLTHVPLVRKWDYFRILQLETTGWHPLTRLCIRMPWCLSAYRSAKKRQPANIVILRPQTPPCFSTSIPGTDWLKFMASLTGGHPSNLSSPAIKAGRPPASPLKSKIYINSTFTSLYSYTHPHLQLNHSCSKCH